MSNTTTACAADTTRESSPLHTVETAFAALCTEPKPLALFGAAVHPQLPASWIPLDGLRKGLITKKYDPHVCDAVWREIIDRSRTEGAKWTVAVAGMAAPALKRVARMITHKRTRPYRPQTNGKVERFNRTLIDEWAYARAYRSEAERRATFPGWLHTYNHHRGHTALKGSPPASRVPNLCGQYS